MSMCDSCGWEIDKLVIVTNVGAENAYVAVTIPLTKLDQQSDKSV